MKLFVTKGACCDWHQYDWLVEHLKYILLQQFRHGEMPCIEPFTLFMLDFSMEDKLIISQKWAQSQTNLALEQLKQASIEPQYLYRGIQRYDEGNVGQPRRLRVGYVSYDFADHALAHLLNSLFKLHDRRLFEIVGFSLRPDDKSVWRKNIEASCDEFYQIEPGLLSFELARFIYSKDIDILFDLNGWTQGHRADVFSLRPCAIQIQFMGFCGTTGADYIDYIVTDELSSPPDVVQKHYSEKAIYMPNSYFLNDYKQTSR